MTFAVSTETRIAGGVTLPPDRYVGTVEWTERLLRSGFERSRKRYRIELHADDVRRWGGEAPPDASACLIEITDEVASGAIATL